MASILAVCVEVLPARDGAIFCECGCGCEVQRADCVLEVSGHPYRPYEVIYRECAKIIDANQGNGRVVKYRPSASLTMLTLYVGV